MHRLVAILFLVLATASTETGIQLARLPVLASHIYTHFTTGKSNSLADFLREHYFEKDHRDEDSGQDEQLPYKSVNPESFSFVYLPAAVMDNAVEIIMTCAGAVKYKDHFTLQDHNPGVFHPPRA